MKFALSRLTTSAASSVLVASIALSFFAFQPTALATHEPGHSPNLVQQGAAAIRGAANAVGNAGAAVLGCTANPGECMVKAVVDGILILLGAIFYGLSVLAAVLVMWAASFFNMAMLVGVFQFGAFFGNSEGLRIAWTVLRDLANMLILFSFLYIGIQMILNLNNFEVKKALPPLIIFAALLNFSLFAAEAVVDTSNALAVGLYKQVGQVDCSSVGQGARQQIVSQEECVNQGLAASIMQAVGVANIFKLDGDELKRAVAGDDHAKNLVVYVGVFVLMIILFFLFVAASIMIVTRALMLMFVFILSPIGFAAGVLPQVKQFKELSKWWWDTLISNAIFAPIFILLLLVSLKIIEGVREPIAGPDKSLITVLGESDTVGVGGVLVIFAIVIGFLVLSLKYAGSSGVFGSEKVSGMALDGARYFGWFGNKSNVNRLNDLEGARKGLEKKREGVRETYQNRLEINRAQYQDADAQGDHAEMRRLARERIATVNERNTEVGKIDDKITKTAKTVKEVKEGKKRLDYIVNEIKGRKRGGGDKPKSGNGAADTH